MERRALHPRSTNLLSVSTDDSHVGHGNHASPRMTTGSSPKMLLSELDLSVVFLRRFVKKKKRRGEGHDQKRVLIWKNFKRLYASSDGGKHGLLMPSFFLWTVWSLPDSLPALFLALLYPSICEVRRPH